ncbi:MAG: rhodanese-like domain-containing protein, partial [Pseudomonadota bacterium]
EVEEPRKGLRSGHIPGSMNVPFTELLNVDKTMKSVDETRAIFEAAGVDLTKPITTSCGSGVTACVLTLALHRMGHSRNAVYDGSWVEWGAYGDLEVETG